MVQLGLVAGGLDGHGLAGLEVGGPGQAASLGAQLRERIGEELVAQAQQHPAGRAQVQVCAIDGVVAAAKGHAAGRGLAWQAKRPQLLLDEGLEARRGHGKQLWATGGCWALASSACGSFWARHG
jgi:hypothetical protein